MGNYLWVGNLPRAAVRRKAFAWGDELEPGGTPQANYWQGEFPHKNTLRDGFLRTLPVGSFPANSFGSYDMIGNVWEWTASLFGSHGGPEAARSCCAPGKEHTGGTLDERSGSVAPAPVELKVLKGGSHLCAANYCQRYRPAARYAQPIDSPTSHIGFRCAASA